MPAALKPILEPEAQGVFPGLRYEDVKVQEWIRRRLDDYTQLSSRLEYNWIRLDSYAFHNRCLILVLDNVDLFYKRDQQAQIFEAFITSLIMNRQNVFLIAPLRPSSRFFLQRRNSVLQHSVDGLHLPPLKMSTVLKLRMERSAIGEQLDRVRVPDSQQKTEWSYADILKTYLGSSAERLVCDLAGDDVRHYIRLFRRLFYSDELNGFENIKSEYYCISALMLRPNERFGSEKSFLVNVFDNEHPNEVGNALIRWRVLEYFLNGHRTCSGDLFEYYFQRLGFDMRRVREVLELWEGAGAIQVFRMRDGDEGEPTRCGMAYARIIRNLWYCIVIKTGMHINTAYILAGQAAVKAASEFKVALMEGQEWVSDSGFLRFLAEEETLEESRVARYVRKSVEMEEKIRSRGPKSIHRVLEYEYTFQERAWEKRRDIASRRGLQ